MISCLHFSSPRIKGVNQYTYHSFFPWCASNLLHEQGWCRRLDLAQFTEKTTLKVFGEIKFQSEQGPTVLTVHSKAELKDELSKLFKQSWLILPYPSNALKYVYESSVYFLSIPSQQLTLEGKSALRWQSLYCSWCTTFTTGHRDEQEQRLFENPRLVKGTICSFAPLISLSSKHPYASLHTLCHVLVP